MAERAAERLLRLLGIVAYLDARGGVPVDEVAAQFGVPAEQVVADVETLWMTGTPGYFPSDLIDFDVDAFERGVLRLTESRGMTRPLRLGGREAAVLVAALRAMAASLGPRLGGSRQEVLEATLAKLTLATGGTAPALDVRLAVDAAPAVLTTVDTALRRHRRLRLRYVDAADRATTREVDPVRLVTGDDRSYLLAWSLAANGERLFRTDRIVSAELLDEPARTHRLPPQIPAYRPGADGGMVTLHLRSRGRWVAETVPVEAVRNLDDGTFEVDLRVTSPGWLRHLLLQAGEDILAVRPPQAAGEAATAARSALAAYRQDGPWRR